MEKKKPTRPEPGVPQNRRNMKNIGFAVIVVLLVLIIFSAYNQPSKLKTIPLTQAISQETAGKYKSILVSGNELDITLKGDSSATIKAYSDPNASLKSLGFDYSKATISYKSQNGTTSAWVTIGESVLPVLVIGALLFFMFRSAQGQGNQALSFGKSKARVTEC